MNTFIVLTTIVSIALASGQAIQATKIANNAGERKAELLNLAKQIAAKISGNQDLMNKLQNAANNKQSDILNAMYRGMGFGKRMQRLAEELEKSRKETEDVISKKSQENIGLQKKIEDINTANANLGISDELNDKFGAEMTGLGKFIKQGKENVRNYINSRSDTNQNINGGITNV